MSISELGRNFHNFAWILIVAVIVLYFGAARALGLGQPGSRRFRRPYRPSRFGNNTGSDLKDVGQQMNAVMAAPFERRRLLSFSEFRAFKLIEDEMAAMRKGYRVFAQTSLGEVLTSPNSDAFHSINSKRVDILIVDRGGWPVVAVEYQGGGHYCGTAAGRDAVKKEALRKAGVGYIEILPSDTDEQIRTRLHEQLGWKSGPTDYAHCSARPQSRERDSERTHQSLPL